MTEPDTIRYGDWIYENGHIIINYVGVPVCSEKRPVVGHYLISRRLDAWQLSPAMYLASGHARPIADMPFYILTNAPKDVDDALSKK